MVDVDKAVLARIRKEGKDIEVLVDSGKALECKKGKKVSLSEVLASDFVYKDSRRGERASETDMKKIFGTNDELKVAEIIIKEGEVQVTKEIRDTEREAKRKQVIEIIHRNSVDSKTGLPHPRQRIESAIEEAKVKIEESKTAEEQIDKIVEKLRVIIPIKFETKKIEVIIPAKYSSASFRVLKEFGKMSKNEWKNDGSLDAVIEMPAGIVDEFFSKLNNICHGEVNSKIIE
jgi:ribosome maturation protein SDO1